MCTSHFVWGGIVSVYTYAVLRAQVLAQGSRHDLAADVTGGIKVGLAVDATRSADHDANIP